MTAFFASTDDQMRPSDTRCPQKHHGPRPVHQCLVVLFLDLSRCRGLSRRLPASSPREALLTPDGGAEPGLHRVRAIGTQCRPSNHNAFERICSRALRFGGRARLLVAAVEGRHQGGRRQLDAHGVAHRPVGILPEAKSATARGGWRRPAERIGCRSVQGDDRRPRHGLDA